MKVDKLFVATKAFVFYKEKVLILRESDKYKDGTNAGGYDIVGGRVEPGQRFDESLLREIKDKVNSERRENPLGTKRTKRRIFRLCRINP